MIGNMLAEDLKRELRVQTTNSIFKSNKQASGVNAHIFVSIGQFLY
ncbi:hypothetical protein I3760_05G238200 [Carya illinoinensis]|nr:hypothetical protein I3760_05G238200 [Carya illinoinensis]